MAAVTCEEVRSAALLSCAAAYKGNPTPMPSPCGRPQHPWAKHVPEDCVADDPGCLLGYFSVLTDMQTFGCAEGGVYGRLALDRCSRRCWVVFRGTQDIKSWLHNLNFDHVEVPGIPGSLHFGFATQLQAALPVVNEYVRSRCPAGFSIYTTGHSLGGALATMYASYVKHAKPGVGVCCLVFGSPRAGNAGFAGALAGTDARVVRFNMWAGGEADDRVTHLPAASTGFKHAGEHRLLRFGDPPAADASMVSRLVEMHHHHRYLKSVFALPQHIAFGAALAAMPQEELADGKLAELIQVGASMYNKLSSAGIAASLRSMSMGNTWLKQGMSAYDRHMHQPQARVLEDED